MGNEINIDSDFSMSISRIKLLQFNIKEYTFIPNATMEIEVAQTLGFNLDSNLVIVDLNISLHYQAEKAKSIEITVQNIFKFQELKRFAIEENTDLLLPQLAYVHIAGLSMSHTRALLAANCSGTLYQDTILPMVDPVQVAKVLYPQAF